MKIAAIAAAALITSTAAVSAADIGNTGISIGAELDNRYNVDAEALTVTLTPEVGYSIAGFGLSASTDLLLADNDGLTLNNDDLPTLDFGAEYGLSMWGLGATAYAETGYDFEAEDMSDVEFGVSFKF